MRKTERVPTEGDRRRGAWIRTGIGPPQQETPRVAAKPEAKASEPASGRSAKRFVEPFQFDDAQRAAIIETLAGDNIGDDTAREIFVGAIAYDLAVLKAAAEPPAPEPKQEAPTASAAPAEPAPKPALVAPVPSVPPLAGAARALAAEIGGLSEQDRQRLGEALRASDPFGRPHDANYLTAVLAEIQRIAEAADRIAPSPAETAPAPGPAEKKPAPVRMRPKPPSAPSPAAIAFIRHAASVYEQCFDTAPTAKASDPFAHVLAAITKAAGVPLPRQTQALRQALEKA